MRFAVGDPHAKEKSDTTQGGQLYVDQKVKNSLMNWSFHVLSVPTTLVFQRFTTSEERYFSIRQAVLNLVFICCTRGLLSFSVHSIFFLATINPFQWEKVIVPFRDLIASRERPFTTAMILCREQEGLFCSVLS